MKILRAMALTIPTLFCSGLASARTLHFISVAETKDVQLPKEFLANKAAIDAYIHTIAGGDNPIKLDPDSSVPDDKFSCDEIRSKVKNIQVQNDDIIFFYYSGHGRAAASSPAGGSSPIFPTLECGTRSTDPGLPLEDVYSALKKSNAELIIVGADTCNYTLPEPPPGRVPANVLFANEKVSMFRNVKGSIMFSSASAGERSFYQYRSEGYFTKYFIKALQNPRGSTTKKIWDNIEADSTEVIHLPPRQFLDEQDRQTQQTPIVKSELNFDPIDSR